MIFLGGFIERKTALVFFSGTMSSIAYFHILENALLPYANEKHGDAWLFQQDNSPCYTSNYTKQLFFDVERDFREYPPRLPDLNPIENLWAVLGRIVYANYCQYDYVYSL